MGTSMNFHEFFQIFLHASGRVMHMPNKRRLYRFILLCQGFFQKIWKSLKSSRQKPPVKNYIPTGGLFGVIHVGVEFAYIIAIIMEYVLWGV